jgi:hypothetical protein
VVNLSKFLSMNVHCAVSYKDEVFKTSSQSGQKPKWNEQFVFNISEEDQNNMIEFTVIHKAFFSSEEKIGSCLFKLHI